MSNTWNEWEGQIVAGKFPLLRYLGGSEHSAVFLTERRTNGRAANAAIKVMPASPEQGDRQLSRWEQASELSHPHLISLYEMGWSELGGVPLVYLVMECAEENLAQVLPDRALTTAEARQMLESVLDVLSYLQGKGFVHGGIKPANIMACGDELKISSDVLRPAGETLEDLADLNAYEAPENARDNLSVPHAMSPANDVWSLGMTLVETLTQNLPSARTAQQQELLIPRTLPEPFLDIASHCLLRDPEERWTIAQIAARLEGRAPAPQVRMASSVVEIPIRAPQPIVQNSRRPAAKRPTYAVPFAIGFVLVVAAILVAPRVLRQHSDTPQISAVVPAAPVAPVAPVANDRPPAPAAPKALQPSPGKDQTKSTKPNFSDDKSGSKTPVAVPALIHPETIREEATNTAARMPVDSPTHGEVAHRAMPDVLQSATNSIRGTVKVRVKVNVDRAGNVEDAELASRGPSKYFARAAVQAAQLWKFNPPKVGGQGVLSSWILEFEFTRFQTTVVPTQQMP